MFVLPCIPVGSFVSCNRIFDLRHAGPPFACNLQRSQSYALFSVKSIATMISGKVVPSPVIERRLARSGVRSCG
jgi:hypothetical protein